jgi:penicillin amidase
MTQNASDPLGSLDPAETASQEPRWVTRGTRQDRAAREAQSSAGRARRTLRRLVAGLVMLVVCVVLGVFGVALWARHAMRAALPVVDGPLTIEGLKAPVTVLRNGQGVPSISATNEDDLLFAQGYVTAQDRLWQMDALRRHAAGELAEILGPSLVAHDKMQRTLQLRAAADRGAAALTADQRRELEAYARGVNAFIGAHRESLPLEFRLLHYAPRPWTPRDSLLVSVVMWQDLSTSFVYKLDREELARHLPQALLADLYPVGSWRDRPPGQPAADLTMPHDVEQIPLDSSQSKLERPTTTADDLLALRWATGASACDGCRAGSNNWAIAGARSASGKPLVSNDMHLGLQVPDIWYEAGLHLASKDGIKPPIDVTGFTLPGLPWVLVGRNAHVAWAFTNLGGDVQEVRVEHLRGSGSSLMFEQADGTWGPVEHHAEHIVVRGGRDVSIDVLTVTHTIAATRIETPIVSALMPSEQRALSLAWTVYDPSSIDASFAGPDSAADGASLVASLAEFGGPSLNLVYADDGNHIGYHAIGRIPVRGPAVQHARAEQPFVLASPEPDSDEEGTGDADALQAAPLAPAKEEERGRQKQGQLSMPGPRGGKATSGKATATKATDTKAAGMQAQIAPQAAGSYTIGSPISPVPVDALDASQAWTGYIPFNALPSVEDPPGGIVATANARIATDDYPYALTNAWADPYRVERIYRLLGQHGAWTPAQMLGVEMDQHSEFDLLLGQRLAYAIDHASAAVRGRDAARLRQAADLLRSWKGEMAVGSPAAAIVAAARSNVWPALLEGQIAAHDGCTPAQAVRLADLYTWPETNTALENLLDHMPARWLPRGETNWNDFLAGVVEQGLREAGAPRDLRRWRYGAMHQVEIEHPLFGAHRIVNLLLGAVTGSGARPAGGDMTTIDAMGRSFGPSERFTADLAASGATLANIVTGESGNVGSPQYLDQLQPWLDGTTFSLPLQGGADHTLMLLPAHRQPRSGGAQVQ